MNKELLESIPGWGMPKCDVLDYILIKIPNVELGNDTDNSKDGQWYAKALGNMEFGETPLDAMTKLAIRLHKESKL
jgi:hypothetical protein